MWKTVVGALIDVTLVRHVGIQQRSVESWPPIGDPLVEFAILRIERGLDLYDIGGVRSGSVETALRSPDPSPSGPPAD